MVPRYAEIDQQGVVFNGHYLTWFDEACTGYLDHLGVTYPGFISAGYDIQVVHSEIDYQAPVRWRDAGYDRRRLLRGLPVPTLVIHGEADLLPISVAEETVGTIEGARLSIVPDVGHMPCREAPNGFLAAADAFLSHDDPETRR